MTEVARARSVAAQQAALVLCFAAGPGPLFHMAHRQEKSLEIRRFQGFGGDKRDRTADLLNAIQALSQLSYTPKFKYAVRNECYVNRSKSNCQEKNRKNMKEK